MYYPVAKTMEPEHPALPPEQPVFWRGLALVAAIAVAIHFACISQYGYFRDELYYLACADRLAWGYVDHPPLCVWLLRLVTSILGDSLVAVRLPAILASAATALTYGTICARLGGGKVAQIAAAAFACLTPVYAVVGHLYSMNSLEVLLWALAALIWLDARKNPRLWIALGVVCGFALLNKLSAGMLVVGIGLATLIGPRRLELRSIYPWVGIAVALAIFAPHLVWQHNHNWISGEFIRNAAELKMVPMPPHLILGVQIVVTNPVMSILWISGLILGLRRPEWRAYLIPYGLMLITILISQRSRENYIAPAYAFVVPIGAIWLESIWSRSKPFRVAYPLVWIPTTASMLAIALPILRPETVRTIANASPVTPPSTERGAKSPIQGFADMFGWPEMASATQKIWHSLPPEDRRRTPIFGQNYGESAAVAFFKTDSAMSVIGQHNNYWLWGPGEWDGEILIIIGEIGPVLRESFDSIEQVDQLNSHFAVPEEAHAPISIARGLRIPVGDFWQRVRKIQ